MCIIIVKKAGIRFPESEILKDCWDNNPDGAGYMYPKNGQVEIRKGFMKYKHLMDSLKSIPNKDDIPMILHFRITTHGGTSKANTHPFPVTSNEKLLRSTRLKTTLAVAHNGIITIDNDKNLSDTMQFIKNELSLFNVIKPNWYKDIKSLDYIGNRIDSKLAIMDGKGYISTVGDFYEDEGILYSNYSYLGYTTYSWNSYSPSGIILTTDEQDLVNRMMGLGLYQYEAEGVLWELTTYEIDYILKHDVNAYEKLLNAFYGTPNK